MPERDRVHRGSRIVVQTDTICPYCGVGCNLTLYVQDNQIVSWVRQGVPVVPVTIVFAQVVAMVFETPFQQHRR